MADAPKQNLQTTAIIAKLFDLDERRVQQLAKSGVLPAASTRPYKFDLLPTVKAYIKHLREKANGKETKTADTAKAEADKLRAEADLKQSKAKIAEMQLKELEGKMHRSEDVEAVTNDLRLYRPQHDNGPARPSRYGRFAGRQRERSLGTDPRRVSQNPERARGLSIRSRSLSAAGKGSRRLERSAR